jgi:hypothetical protein
MGEQQGAGRPGQVAERLLRSTAAHSFDPDTDIDWAAPLAPDKDFLLAHRCSLYGTPLWDAMTPQQRRELGMHEAASVASTGIWLEGVLMRMLTNLAYHGDAASPRVRYALAELAEECRHSTMFAMMIERLGAPTYRPSRLIHTLGGLLSTTARGTILWGAVLLGEELTDRYQREQMGEESIQPLLRMVNRIHVTEEARHISFARAELTRAAATLTGAQRPYHRMVLGQVALVVSRSLIHPGVYAAVGLDPHAARKAALANPYHRETIRYGGEKIVPFLAEAGLIGPPAMHWWRRSFLVPS